MNRPISPEQVASGSISLDWLDVHQDGSLYFVEGRPSEGGRQTLLRRSPEGAIQEITPSPLHIRSRVHEYGGKAYCLLKDGGVAIINNGDGSLYINEQKKTDGRVRLGEMIEAGDGLIAVAEEGQDNFLAFIDRTTGEITPLFNDSDFVAAPTLSPDGKQLAWLTWNHPAMPWDGSTLWVGDLEGKKLNNVHSLRGGPKESILQPEWGPSGELYYISDKSGFWNLYQDDLPLFPIAADCAKPLWVLGMRSYAVDGDNIVLAFQHEGKFKIAHRRKGEWTFLPFECADISSIRLQGDNLYFAAGFKDDSRKIASFNLSSWELKKLYGQTLELETFSLPQSISFYSGGHKVTGFYYPPVDPSIASPPLIVKVHGGPTAQITEAFNWTVAYWTSHGFAFLEVNYRGSSGSGRPFREALNGHWGVYDAEDCEAGAKYLADQGLVDRNALFITGGSSGGFTVLATLINGNMFKGGTSYYGVTDLELLRKETHKFESHYLDTLIGEKLQNLAVEKLEKPILFLHGKEDKVVPPDQPIALYTLLKAKGIPTKFILYDAEAHGFRRRETIINALTEEKAFYDTMRAAPKS